MSRQGKVSFFALGVVCISLFGIIIWGRFYSKQINSLCDALNSYYATCGEIRISDCSSDFREKIYPHLIKSKNAYDGIQKEDYNKILFGIYEDAYDKVQHDVKKNKLGKELAESCYQFVNPD